MGRVKNIQIERQQFFVLFVLYILANDNILGMIGGQLKQDFWIAQLVAITLSIVLFAMYLLMLKNLNYPNFTEMLKLILGSKIGILLILIYAVYFIFLSSLQLRDITELINTYYLNEAPLLILALLFMSGVVFSAYYGIEVTARMGHTIFFITYLTFFIFVFLVITFNDVEFVNILPILDKGVKPLIRPSILMSIGVPFGELFVLLFLIQHLNEKKSLLKISILAQLIAAFTIIIITLFSIAIIGPELIPHILTYTMKISKKIDIRNFTQRFDLFTLMILIYLAYIKITILLYGSKECLTHVFSKINRNVIIIFVSIASIVLALYLVKDYIQFIELREQLIIPYVKGTFEVAIPFALFVLSFLRKPKKETNDDEILEEKNKNKLFTFVGSFVRSRKKQSK